MGERSDEDPGRRGQDAVADLSPAMVEDLRRLLVTMIELGSDLDEETVLRRAVAGACAVTGASRGLVEVLDPDGRVTRTLTERGTPYRRAGGRGEAGPRLSEELVVAGVPVARLTVLEAGGRRPFDSFDARRVAAVARTAETALRNARMHAESERRRTSLEAAAQVAHAISTDVPLAEVLLLVTGSLRRALGATAAGVLVPDPSGLHEVRALDIQRGFLPRSRTLYAEARTALEEMLVSGGPRVLTIGRDVIAVHPVEREGAGRRLLGVWWAGRTAPVADEEWALVATLAEQAGVAMDREQAAGDRERLLVVSERERIARDLHDVVIQRIFAAGLQVRNLLRRDDLMTVREGLEGALVDLDLTIRDIRTTIFALHHDTAPRLREDARLLLAEYAPVLGCTPLLETHGDLDADLDPVAVEHLLATLRELLSNVARHAGAGACRVRLALDGGWLALEVADDGSGIDLEAPRSGLANVAFRATLLGGESEVLREESGGTVVRWRVPVPPPGEGAGEGPGGGV